MVHGLRKLYWSTERLIEFAPRRVSANIYQGLCRPVYDESEQESEDTDYDDDGAVSVHEHDHDGEVTVEGEVSPDDLVDRLQDMK